MDGDKITHIQVKTKQYADKDPQKEESVDGQVPQKMSDNKKPK